jgi:hypothetical protein
VRQDEDWGVASVGESSGVHYLPTTGTSTAQFSEAPPRVTRSFAFLDLCGFTTFVDTYGDLAALAELTTLRRILRVAALLHRTRVDKWLGDGALLVALDLETMLQAVLAAGKEHHGQGKLLLRGGVTAGPAILCDDDYVGAVVNLASRLCDAAEPGTILVQRTVETATMRGAPTSPPIVVNLLPPGPAVVTESVVTETVVAVEARVADDPLPGMPPSAGKYPDGPPL